MFMCSPTSMAEEDLGAWLRLGIGGGGGGGCPPKRSHAGDRRSAVQFPQSGNKEVETIHKQALNKNTDEKKGGGARKRFKSIDDVRSSSHSPSPGEDGDDDDGGEDGGTRKKLRLTKEQSTLLEDTFRSHNILSHAQKHDLARRVNLTPRQVEVWFQNRRARTKMKQTEVDCEVLKRCCAKLTDENQRLKHELMELQMSAAAAGLYVRFPRVATGTASVCPSCDKVTVASGGETSKSSTSYSS